MNCNRMKMLALLCALTTTASAHEEHSHPAPEVLGTVTFATTCTANVQPRFERALALLHSFAYTAAEQAFRDVVAADPKCAIAHWGVAMSMFHQLWENPAPPELAKSAAELEAARALDGGSPRERTFIEAATVYFCNDPVNSCSGATPELSRVAKRLRLE